MNSSASRKDCAYVCVSCILLLPTCPGGFGFIYSKEACCISTERCAWCKRSTFQGPGTRLAVPRMNECDLLTSLWDDWKTNPVEILLTEMHMIHAGELFHGSGRWEKLVR